MKRTLITLGTLASIAVLPDTAWACEYGCGGGHHRGGGGFGAGAILGGVIGVIGGVLATKAQEQPRPDPYRTRTTRKSEPEKKKLVRPAAVTQPPKTKVSRAVPPVTPPKPPSAPAQRPPSLPTAAPGDEIESSRMKSCSKSGIQSLRRQSMTLPVKIGLHASPRNASN